jgi:hypothetical protein
VFVVARGYLCRGIWTMKGEGVGGFALSWQDGEGGHLERFVQEIATEVVTTAEIGYRERCVRAFEWRVRRKAKLEEDARNYQLQLEREARERQQQLEQARIDRLLDEAALRRATDIRDYSAP